MPYLFTFPNFLPSQIFAELYPIIIQIRIKPCPKKIAKFYPVLVRCRTVANLSLVSNSTLLNKFPKNTLSQFNAEVNTHLESWLTISCPNAMPNYNIS